MNSYSVPVCICIDLLVHYIQLLRVSIFLCWNKRILVSDFVSLCDNWKGVMTFNCFVPPKVQSITVYFMYDRDNFFFANLTIYIFFI